MSWQTELRSLKGLAATQGLTVTFRWKHGIATAELRRDGVMVGCGNAKGPLALVRRVKEELS